MTKFEWHKGPIEWVANGTAHLSVVFTWDLPAARQSAAQYKLLGYNVRAGGPAVKLHPEYLQDLADTDGHIPTLHRHNPHATRTSRGCPNSCPFCAVPITEGDLRELDNWQPRPLVCDDNLLACSRAHFDHAIDRLKPIPNVDFNQGLDARFLTPYHAQRLIELKLKFVRLAWDSINSETAFLTAYHTLRKAGVPKKKIRVYVLIGFRDTPEDALYRLQTVKDLGSWPNPMRYQPLDAHHKNQYVSPNWTDQQLKRYMRYWSRQRWLAAVPFKEYNPTKTNAKQNDAQSILPLA